MQKGPLIPALSLAAGIATSSFCGLSWWWGAIPIAIALIMYVILIRVSKDPVTAFRVGRWHMVWVIMLFVGIGLTDEALNRPLTLEKAFKGNVPDSLYCEVTGVLSKTYGERIDIIIDGTNGAKARIISGVTEITPGNIIRVQSCSLKEVTADTTTIGQSILPMMKASGILYAGRIAPQSIQVVGRSSSPTYFFFDIRENIEKAIERSHLKKNTADFLKAVLLGDRTGLDEHTRLTFAHGGMAHMLALSGLHIGILAGFFIFLMWPIKLTGHYKWVYGAGIIMLWIYVAVTGMAHSSVRACIMTTFAFIGIIYERKNLVSNALFSACLLILLVNPAALFDAGFQLSIVCVGALIAFSSHFNPIDHRQHPELYYICGALLATMIATAASWVLTSYYFSQIPLMFLPTNVILLPILPLYLSLAVVFVILLTVGVQIGWLGQVLDNGYESLLKSIDWLSNGTEFVVEYQTPLWSVVLWFLILASCAYIINRKNAR